MRRSARRKGNLGWIRFCAALAPLVLAASPAEAGRGIRYVHFDPTQPLCVEGQFEPCDGSQGIGNSNTIEVHQQKIDGRYVFSEIHVPGVPDGLLRISARYGAQCRVGYGVKTARIYLGNPDTQHQGEGLEVGMPWDGWHVPHIAGTRTIPDDVQDMWVPLDAIFDQPVGVDSRLWGFATLASIYDYGEAIIAARVASGMSEAQARALPFEEQTFLGMHGYVSCEGNTFGRVYARESGELLPITIKFIGDPTLASLELDEEPPAPGSADLTFDDAVVQAFLSVQPDPTDPRRLALSGVLETNGAMDGTDRFADER